MTNQQTVHAVNTLRVEVNNLLEQRSSLPNRLSQDSITTQSTNTNTQPSHSSKNLHTSEHRAQDCIATIDVLFSIGQTSADHTPMERHARFTDDIAKVSLQNVELVRQSIRQTSQINSQQETVAASKAQDTILTLDNTTRKTTVPTLAVQPLPSTVVRP